MTRERQREKKHTKNDCRYEMRANRQWWVDPKMNKKKPLQIYRIVSSFVWHLRFPFRSLYILNNERRASRTTTTNYCHHSAFIYSPMRTLNVAAQSESLFSKLVDQNRQKSNFLLIHSHRTKEHLVLSTKLHQTHSISLWVLTEKEINRRRTSKERNEEKNRTFMERVTSLARWPVNRDAKNAPNFEMRMAYCVSVWLFFFQISNPKFQTKKKKQQQLHWFLAYVCLAYYIIYVESGREALENKSD